MARTRHPSSIPGVLGFWREGQDFLKRSSLELAWWDDGNWVLLGVAFKKVG